MRLDQDRLLATKTDETRNTARVLVNLACVGSLVGVVFVCIGRTTSGPERCCSSASPADGGALVDAREHGVHSTRPPLLHQPHGGWTSATTRAAGLPRPRTSRSRSACTRCRTRPLDEAHGAPRCARDHRLHLRRRDHRDDDQHHRRVLESGGPKPAATQRSDLPDLRDQASAFAFRRSYSASSMTPFAFRSASLASSSAGLTGATLCTY